MVHNKIINLMSSPVGGVLLSFIAPPFIFTKLFSFNIFFSFASFYDDLFLLYTFFPPQVTTEWHGTASCNWREDIYSSNFELEDMNLHSGMSYMRMLKTQTPRLVCGLSAVVCHTFHSSDFLAHQSIMFTSTPRVFAAVSSLPF